MDPGFIALLQCPACASGPMCRDGRRLVCQSCGVGLDADGGILDCLGISARGDFTAPTPEQSFMESELVARIYERFWRPAFVRVIAGSGASASTGGFAGEFFVHKNSLAMEDRQGPWLDLSCGSGLFTRAMAAAVPGETVVGLDISRAMLEVAARRAKGYSNVAFVRADAHEMPFVEASFGGINNAGALHAYDDAEQVFREVWRLLKPGGIYVGSTFSRARSIAARMTARIAGIRRFDPTEMHSWLSRIGFADYEELRFEGVFIFRVRKP